MNRIIVSMTTISSRTDSLKKVIDSINRQSVNADIIDITVYSKDIENLLVTNEYENVVVHYTDDDIKGHKKYYNSFKKYTDDIVITLDDDVIYHEDTIAKLIEYHEKFPNAVIANRGRVISLENKGIGKYSNWRRNAVIGVPAMQIMATGVLGVLYCPKWFLGSKLFDMDMIHEENILTNDDIWLKYNELLLGIPTVITDLDKTIQEACLNENNLTHINHETNATDLSIKYIEEHDKVSIYELIVGSIAKMNVAKLYDGHHSTVYKLGEYLVVKKIKNPNANIMQEVNGTRQITNNTDILMPEILGYDEAERVIFMSFIEPLDDIVDRLTLELYNKIKAEIDKLSLLEIDKSGFNEYLVYALNTLGMFEDKFGMSKYRLHDVIHGEWKFCHGDISRDNVFLSNGRIAILDAENSGALNYWWDADYIIADYPIDMVDKAVLDSLSYSDKCRVALLKEVRIGRLIRKNMDISEKLADYKKTLEVLGI